MRRMLAIAFIVMLAGIGTASAEIQWAGNAYPLHGTGITPTGDQFVVAQVYKDAVTGDPGQGPDIAATLYYTTDIAAQVALPMAYNTDVGNNDEYIGYIPQSALVGAMYVDVTVIFEDLTDGTTFEITGDQQNNPPPLRYDIVDVTPVDITVTFSICIEGIENSGPVCVIGSDPAIGEWGTGVMLNSDDGDLWTGDVVFPAGSNPAFEYKFRKDVCQTWESTANRVVVLPTDGTDAVVLDVDSWEFGPLLCGMGSFLGEDKEVCLQVCLEGVEYTGGVCASGSSDELGSWGDGIPMTQIGPYLYQVCFTYPQGSPYPISAEYKFRKDDCANWEDVPNRSFTVEDASETSQTLTSAWNNGPSMCEPVSSDQTTWGGLKSLYR